MTHKRYLRQVKARELALYASIRHSKVELQEVLAEKIRLEAVIAKQELCGKRSVNNTLQLIT